MLRTVVRRVDDARASRALSSTGRRVRRDRLTYLTAKRLLSLEECAREVNAQEVPGDFLECGVALGGSGVLLASMLGPGRHFHGYDVFGMIPPPGPNDLAESHERYAEIAAGQSAGLGGDVYYGYRDDLLAQVSESFTRFGLAVGERVHLHRGLFEDTLNVDGPVALAHIDSDWFEPVTTCLERIAPHLSAGGLIVLDDYHDYGGCRAAVEAYIAGRKELQLRPLTETMSIVRVAP
ncbi:MAG: O-methyltransferase [Baekduia sp.]|jgi:asparagine synthase (glutamine-hydrolysing)|nr:O-methyltransferase [Baekduia sp.]